MDYTSVVIFFPSQEENPSVTCKKLPITINKHCIKLGIILPRPPRSLRRLVQTIRLIEAQRGWKIINTLANSLLWILLRKSASKTRLSSVWGYSSGCLQGFISMILHFLSCDSIYHDYSLIITPEALLPANTPRMFFYEKSRRIMGE